ncbi:MAG TPA: hypothetical protein VHB27_22905 [Rhodopila sp.]|nr:hypothetical protein [Rhodopila sp.]HVY18087.1 hypothetical protein [Rhodopila sp.]
MTGLVRVIRDFSGLTSGKAADGRHNASHDKEAAITMPPMAE